MPSKIRVVAAMLEKDGKYLITQRREGAVLPLLWEFPGGRVEEGETDEAALHREVRHRVGADVTVKQTIAEHHHEYDGYDVHLTLYECHMAEGGEPKPL